MASQRRRATPRQGAEDAPVLSRQPEAVLLDEAIAVRADDVGHLKGWPSHGFCSRRDRRAVSGPAIAIVSKGLVTACKCRRERWR